MLTSEPKGKGFVPLPSVALVIEVADTTLKDDLGRKRRRYAAAGVPEYWVADVNGRVIHQMSAPIGELYSEHREMPFGARVTAATIEGIAVETDAL